MSHDPSDRPKSDEFRIIEDIRLRLGRPSARVKIGIGDDAALCESPPSPLLFCNDAMVEGTHFRLDWMSAADLGHKALASALSDVAAMNGQPLYALIALALRPHLPPNFAYRFADGLGSLAKRFAVDVVGGDLIRSASAVFVDIAVIGHSSQPLTRSGASPGDLLAVSGPLGSSRAGLEGLRRGIASLDPSLLNAHRRPVPRFDVIEKLGSIPGLLTSMIDISDGLSSELHHLAGASSCGFEVDERKIPVAAATRNFAEQNGLDIKEWIWAGGEDYELLMTLNSERWLQECRRTPAFEKLVTVIGQVTPERGTLMYRDLKGDTQPILAKGWNHFD